MLQSFQPRRRRGFTLIELLVVSAIIAILMGLLVAAVQKVREAANRMTCQNNLKQWALACYDYHDRWRVFPPGGVLNPPGNTSLAWKYNHGGWTLRVLPYMEQQNVFDQIPNLDVPFQNAVSDAWAAGRLPDKLPYLRCPSDPDLLDRPLTNYAGSGGPQCWHGPNCGVDNDVNQKYCNGTSDEPPLPAPYLPGYAASPNLGWFRDGKPLSESQVRGMFGTYGPAIRYASVPDGVSNTLLLGECLPTEHPGRDGHWALAGPSRVRTTIIPINHHTKYLDDDGCTVAPRRYYKNLNVSGGFRSLHPGGVNFAVADGSVRFLSQTIDRQTYQYLGCRNDGQPASFE